MACVIFAIFFVLVNGSPSNFFKSYTELRQCYPLSQYIFLLVIEGLSKYVMRYKSLGLIKGIKVSSRNHMTHQLLVDVVLMFGEDFINKWRHIN